MNRETTDTLLGNGLRVLAVHTPGAPLAELRLVLPYARTGPPGPGDAQELLAACLGTGTTAGGGGTRQDIADRAADLGAELSTVVTAESLVMGASVLRPGLGGALELLADLLLRPAYREDELALARWRSAAGTRTPGPRQRLRRALLARAFGAHPLTAAPAADRPDAAAPDATAPDAAALHRLHARAVVPGGAVLLVLSGEAPDTVTALVRRHLDGWTGGPSGLLLPPFARSAPLPGRLALTGPAAAADTDQALVLAAGPAVPEGDPAHAPLHLAQLVLGGYASSLLVRRIRDRHGLAYAVSAGLRGNRAGHWLEVECAGAPGGSGRMAAEVTACLRELAEDGPAPGEVERARAYATGFTRFALATRTEEASALAGFAAAGLPLDWLESYRAALARVTYAQVAEAAARFLDPAGFLVSTLDTAPAPHSDSDSDSDSDSESERWTP
ncbi:M16 family metallopeptidase [Streptomyces sp. NPDC059982]|uniref:M16 family metallopeptidase n=1 Tax=unclassified Streptomyces TaxID=2593676 RepID=UPI0036B07153